MHKERIGTNPLDVLITGSEEDFESKKKEKKEEKPKAVVETAQTQKSPVKTKDVMTEIERKGREEEQQAEAPIQNSSTKGLKPGWVRKTMEMRISHAEDIDVLAWWERTNKKNIVDQALDEYFQRQDPATLERACKAYQEQFGQNS